MLELLMSEWEDLLEKEEYEPVHGALHQEIVEIHIRHYEPPKCIMSGCSGYELVTIL
jgi:hypothetical protein